jgi:esterase/lipase superfamily enzyme
MQKVVWTWKSQWLREPARMARWGHFGTPLLVFPTAGGDFEEIERFQLIAAVGQLIEGGRIKVYALDAPMIRGGPRSYASTA